MSPLVSIVIPCYNHGAFLPETLKSVEAQTFRDFEVVIVDDGSTDSQTIKVLTEIDQPGLRVIRTTNHGVSAARNSGIQAASGKYILTLDADDMIAERYLEVAVPVLDCHDDVGVVCCERQLFGERQGRSVLPDYDARRMLVENLVYPTALFRKKDWAAIGGYNEAMVHGWEDWDFWIAMSVLGRTVVRLPEEYFFYRVRSSSRDHSLRFLRKLQMFWLMVCRNHSLYLRNLSYVIVSLCRIHLLRQQLE